MTGSMQKAIAETQRRRTKQTAFNEANGITPVGVTKRIKDIIDGVYDVDDEKAQWQSQKEKAKYEDMGEKDLAKEIKRLEKEMQDFARNLEFEKAAQARDRLSKVRAMAFGALTPDNPLP
jgi:excinuclease ABC subunit B